MFSVNLILTLELGYMFLLFLLALWVEHKGKKSWFASNPIIYSLSWAVYCTAWTFYGNVGKATISGLLFLPFYIGTTIAVFLGWIVWRKMVRLKNKFHITCLADLISTRYGKSQFLGMLVSVGTLFGTLPYIALQLKSIIFTINIISVPENTQEGFVGLHIGGIIVCALIGFTIIFGLRKIDPTERHQGMIAVVAAESVIKLIALMSVGIFVTFILFDGLGDIFQKVGGVEAIKELGNQGSFSSRDYATWFTSLLLSISAIMFLPRQFHVAVVENSDERHILSAMWIFPLYLILIAIFVLPIALGGLLYGLPSSEADFFVLKLPLAEGHSFLALAAFLGGFSASTSMIMITSMTMAVMISNYIFLPIVGMVKGLNFLRRYILVCRWVIVSIYIFMGYLFYLFVGESIMLVNTGVISFAAILQFAPIALGGLFWKQANKWGAITGLCAGFAAWFYTLVIPSFVRSGLLAESLLTDGPFGIALLRPEQFLGMQVLDAIPHATFWSMLLNISCFIGVSLLVSQDKEEAEIADEFIDICAEKAALEHPKSDLIADIDFQAKRQVAEELLGEYFPAETVKAILADVRRACNLSGSGKITVMELADYLSNIERRLAGAIGSAAAHKAMTEKPFFLEKESELLSRVFSEMLVAMRITPDEMNRKIDYYKERDSLLETHAKELEEKISEREKEISIRKAAEEALIESKERFRELAELLPEIVFETDSTGQLVFVNQAAFEVSGYSREDVEKGLNVLTFFSAEDRQKVGQNVARLMKGEVIGYNEYDFIRKDGTAFPVITRSIPIIRDGKPVGIRGILFDITERKKAEESLRKLRNLLQNIIDSMPSMLLGVSLDGYITQWNREAERVTGVKAEKAKGAMLTNVFPQLGSEMKNVELAIRKRQPLKETKITKIIEGKTVTLDVTVFPLIADGVEGAVIRVDDVTEKTRMEEMMIQTEKMLSVGGLAAGMAHEINNPLAGIMQNAQVLKNRISGRLSKNIAVAESCGTSMAAIEAYMECRQIFSIIELIGESSQRAARIVNNMLAFSRKSTCKLEYHDLTRLLEDTLELAANDYDLKKKYDFRQIEIVRDYEEGMPKVFCEGGQIQQVVLNLLKNGAQAMSAKREIGLDSSFIIRAFQDGEWAVVEVEDNGPGMSEEVRKRIFEPFFTTKEVGVGTGLGLSVSYFIITENHGGTITVESAPGRGAKFSIRLPLKHRQRGQQVQGKIDALQQNKTSQVD